MRESTKTNVRESRDILPQVLRAGAEKLKAQALEAEVNELLTEYTEQQNEKGRAFVVGSEHHPKERQMQGSEPVEVDLEEVFQAAQEYDVALELYAQPQRLDLKDVYVKQAKEFGVKLLSIPMRIARTS